MTPDRMAAVILASGLSLRFGQDDKLLAPLKSKPIAAHCADLVMHLPLHAAFAVVPAANQPLAELFADRGIKPIFNAVADEGQGTSLALGIKSVQPLPVEGVLVLLADMPFVSPDHIAALAVSLGDADAAASRHNGVLQPPIIFSRTAFAQLADLKGDKGGRAVLSALGRVAATDIPDHEAIDIDTPETLAALSVD